MLNQWNSPSYTGLGDRTFRYISGNFYQRCDPIEIVAKHGKKVWDVGTLERWPDQLTRDVDKRDNQLRGKWIYESVLSGRGGSERWLNTGCHLLTVALSSSHWFPVKCIAETRRSALKRHHHELFFETSEGDSVRDAIYARQLRRGFSYKCCFRGTVLCSCQNRGDERSRTSEPGWRRRQWRKAHEAKWIRLAVWLVLCVRVSWSLAKIHLGAELDTKSIVWY